MSIQLKIRYMSKVKFYFLLYFSLFNNPYIIYFVYILQPEQMGNSHLWSVSQDQNPVNENIVQQVRNIKAKNMPKKGYGIKKQEHNPLTAAAKFTLENLSNKIENHHQYEPNPQFEIFLIKQYNATYQGQFKKGIPEGRGVVHFSDGSFYSGEFENGEANGNGIYIFPNGSLYSGLFNKSQFNGKGSLIFIDSRLRFSGQFVNGYPIGKGKEKFNDGSEYQGAFKNGQKHGKGIYRWENGLQYEGQFVNGVMNGKGILIDTNRGQVLYKGNFKDGKKDGKAVFRTSDGSYQGIFENDLLNGIGTFVWNDGKVYEGQFKDSKMEGEGKIYFPTNQIAEGIWQKNHNKILNSVVNDPSAQVKIQQIKFRHLKGLQQEEEQEERQSEIKQEKNNQNPASQHQNHMSNPSYDSTSNLIQPRSSVFRQLNN